MRSFLVYREGNETLFGFTTIPDDMVLTSGNLVMGWDFLKPGGYFWRGTWMCCWCMLTSS